MSLQSLRQHQEYLVRSLHITQRLIDRLTTQSADIECSLSKIPPTRKEKKRLLHARWRTNKTLQTCKNEEQMLLKAVEVCQGRIQACETEWMYLDAAQHASTSWTWPWVQPNTHITWPDWQWSSQFHWRDRSPLFSHGGYSYGPYLQTPCYANWPSSDFAQSNTPTTPESNLSSIDMQTHGWPMTLPTTSSDLHAFPSVSPMASSPPSISEDQNHGGPPPLATIAEGIHTNERRDSVLRGEASPFKPTTIARRRLLSFDEPISPRTLAPPWSPGVIEKKTERKYSAAAVDLLEYRFSHSPKRSRRHSRQRSNAATQLRNVEEMKGQGGNLSVGSKGM